METLLSFLCPPLGLPIGLVGLNNRKQNWKKYIFLIALFVAVLAYAYEPTGNTDLIRYFAKVERYKNAPISSVFSLEFSSRKENLVLFELICWVIAKIGDVHLLPFFSAFFTYYIGLYLTYDIWTNDERPFRSGACLFYVICLLLSLHFFNIVNSIRNVLAFALIALAAYRDIIKRKFNIGTILLYIIPLFLHTSSLLFIIARLLSSVKGKKFFGICLATALSNPILQLISPIVLKGGVPDNIVGGLFYNLVYKSDRYFAYTSTSGYAAVYARTTTYLRILYIMLMLLILFFDWQNLKLIRSENNGTVEVAAYEKWIHFSMLMALLTLSCSTMLMPEYWRFANSTILVSAPSVVMMINHPSNRFTQVFKWVFFIFSFGIFSLWMYVFMVSNFELNSFILKPWVSSPIIMLIKDLFLL